MKHAHAIHAALRAAGRVSSFKHTFRVLEACYSITATNCHQAARYAEDDLIRYADGSKKINI